MEFLKVKFNIIFIYMIIFLIIIKSQEESDLYKIENNLFSFQKEIIINNDEISQDYEMIEEKIEIGKIYKEYLYYPYEYVYNFNTNEFEGDIVRIHFYSFDSEVEIYLSDSISYKKINKINHYDNAFYVDINKDKINTSSIIIKPLKNLLNDKIINRTCIITINSIVINKPQLETKYERDSSIIYFDQNLYTMKFSFDYIKKDFALFSFLIKETALFEITAIKNEKEILLKKNISYNDQIIFSSKTFNMNNSCNLTILINKLEKDKNVVMKFSVSSKNTIYLLEKNEVNFHFTTNTNREQFYYTELFQGEEGEIILNNKRKGGFLYAQIINRTMDITNITKDIFPKNNKEKEDEYIVNKRTTQKLIITSNDTYYCYDGCYLLITFCSKNAFQEEPIYGGLHTLLPKFWDDIQVVTQLTQIYFNEQISGTFENYIKKHYYYLFIPKDVDYLIIEIKGNNMKALLGEGKIIINNKNDKIYEIISENNDKSEDIVYLYCHDLKTDSFKEKYISLSFSENYKSINNDLSYYSFRILKGYNSNIQIFSLDSDHQNICKPSNMTTHFSCFYLLKNDYNELSFPMTIHAFTEYQNSLVSIKGRLINKNDLYNINNINLEDLEINYSDVNSITLAEKYKISESYSMIFEFSINENYNIKIISTILNNYLNDLTLYSPLLCYNGDTKPIEYDLNMNYIISIKNIKGTDSAQYTTHTAVFLYENQIVNFAISSRFKIFRIKKQNLISFIKLTNPEENEILPQINFGYTTNFITLDKPNPVFYYLKFQQIRSLEINFYFSDIKKQDCDFKYNIQGAISFNYDIIKSISNNQAALENPITGIYNNYTNIGFIKFNSKYISEYKNNGKDDDEKSFIDKYFIIKIEPTTYYLENSQFFINSLVTENIIYGNNTNYEPDKKNNHLLINKYISGSLNPLSTNLSKLIERYKIIEDEPLNQLLIFEFSSNYKDINIEFFINNTNNITYIDYDKRVENGIQKLILKSIVNNFTMEISTDNNCEELNSTIKYINYMLKYYYYDEKNEISDYIFNNCPKITKLSQYDNEIDLNLTFENAYFIKNNNTHYLNCTYFIRLYSSVIKNELLNTTAFINSNVIFSKKIMTNESQQNFTINLYELLKEKKYSLSVLIKIKKKSNQNNEINNDSEELLRAFEIEINPKDYMDTDNNTLIFIIVSSLLFIIIVIVVTITIYLKMKNKHLKERILSISFTDKDEHLFEKDSNGTKSEEDYENTFI